MVEFGKGLVTERQGLPGEVQNCKNIYLGQLEGKSRVETRKRVKRDYATRPANAKVLMLGELRAFDGTRVKLIKVNGNLYDADDIAGGSLKASLSTTAIADICYGNEKAFIADDENFVVTKAKAVFDLVKANGGGTLSPIESGTATGFGTGTYRYMFTDYDPTNGWESLPSSEETVVKTNINLGVQVSDPGNYTAQYSKKRIYRRARDDNSWYLVKTAVTGDFPYSDALLEDDFTSAMLSEVHNNTSGITNMEIPAVATTCAFFRGRLFLGYEDNVRWSKIDLSFIFKSDGVATKRIGDDGDKVVRIVSWNESLIIFKRYSIWVMNGDVNEEAFTFYPATKTLGAISQFAIALTPQYILFLGSDGRVWTFNLSKLDMLSSHLALDQTLSSADTFSAGWDRYQNCIYLTTDQATYIIFGKEFGKVEYAMNKVVPSVWGEITNSAGERKLNFGSTDGFIYETETTNTIDGVSSGTVSGTATSATSNTLTDSGASFNTTGDGLIGLSLTINGVSYTIASNTGTVITIAGTFSPALAGTEDYSIGSMYSLWHSVPLDDSSPLRKRIQRIVFAHRLVVGSITYGVTLERNTDLTAITKLKVATGLYRVVLPVRYRAFRYGPFVFGTDVTFDFVSVNVEPKKSRGDVE